MRLAACRTLINTRRVDFCVLLITIGLRYDYRLLMKGCSHNGSGPDRSTLRGFQII